jgi:DNA-binding NarL/FixJ family response regulator
MATRPQSDANSAAADGRTGAVISVTLIDDHPVIAAGLRLAFAASERFVLANAATDPAIGLAELERHRPDAVVLDLVFEGVMRFDLVQSVRARLPAAAVIVFSSLPETLYAPRARAAGADAYLSKSADLSLLADVIGRHRSVTRPPALGDERLAFIPQAGQTIEGIHLTPREFETARLIARGLPIGAIAAALEISANTAAVHRDNVRKKLQCRDTKALIARLARIDAFDLRA